MADSVRPKVDLLCSNCGCEDVLKLPKFCPECGKPIDKKDFRLATSDGNSKHLDSQGATQASDASNDGSSSGTSQLPSEGSGNANRGGQMVDTVTHPLDADDQSSSSQSLSSQTNNQQRPQGINDQPQNMHNQLQDPQGTCSLSLGEPQGKDSDSHNTQGNGHHGQGTHTHDDNHGQDTQGQSSQNQSSQCQETHKQGSSHSHSYGSQSQNSHSQETHGQDSQNQSSHSQENHNQSSKNQSSHSQENHNQGSLSQSHYSQGTLGQDTQNQGHETHNQNQSDCSQDNQNQDSQNQSGHSQETHNQNQSQENQNQDSQSQSSHSQETHSQGSLNQNQSGHSQEAHGQDSQNQSSHSRQNQNSHSQENHNQSSKNQSSHSQETHNQGSLSQSHYSQGTLGQDSQNQGHETHNQNQSDDNQNQGSQNQSDHSQETHNQNQGQENQNQGSQSQSSHSQETHSQGSQNKSSHSQEARGQDSQNQNSHSQENHNQSSKNQSSHSQETHSQGSLSQSHYSQGTLGQDSQNQGHETHNQNQSDRNQDNQNQGSQNQSDHSQETHNQNQGQENQNQGSQSQSSHSQETHSQGSQNQSSHSQEARGQDSQNQNSHSQENHNQSSKNQSSHSQETHSQGSLSQSHYSQGTLGQDSQNQGHETHNQNQSNRSQENQNQGSQNQSDHSQETHNQNQSQDNQNQGSQNQSSHSQETHSQDSQNQNQSSHSQETHGRTSSPVVDLTGDDTHVPDSAKKDNTNKFDGEADTRMDGISYKKEDDLKGTKREPTRKNANVTTPKGEVQLNFNPPKFHEKNKDPYVLVEFHVILSKEEWLWDDSAEVYIQFSHQYLGNFRWCYGPMIFAEGSVESDDITELVYTVEVPIAACRYPYCNYKYCVFSDATKEIMKTPFEFIASQTATGKIIDRSLKFIDSVHLTKGAMYRKFDGSMHPEFDKTKLKEIRSKEESKSSWLKSLAGSFTGLLSKLSNYMTTSGEPTVKNVLVVSTYFSKYYKILTGERSTHAQSTEIINEIVYIYNSLFKGYFCYDGSYRHLQREGNVGIKKEMYEWLVKIIDSYEKQENCYKFNILQCDIILLMIIKKLNLLEEMFLEKHYQILFKGLCVIPEFKSTESWPDFVQVKEDFLKDDKNKSEFIQFLKYMQRKALNFGSPIPQVLFSLPLLHFAQGVWKPFEVMTKLPTMDSTIRSALSYFKEITAKCIPQLLQFLDDHPHLFAVDQLLLYFIVQASPLETYNKLVEKVPLFMMLAGLMEKIPLSNKQKELDMLELFVKIGSGLEYSSETRTLLIATVDSTLQLVKRGREKYDDLNKQLFSMVELYLLLREKIAIAVEDDEIFSLVHNKWNLQGFVQELIQALMPLREFGGYLHKYSKEIMIWSTMDKINCPKCFEAEWHSFIEEVITARISEAKSQLKDIFLSINLDTTPEFLIEIILTYMSTNYEHIEHEDLESSTILQHMLRSPTRLRHNIANRVLNLLSEMINRRYPQATDVTETDLLDWKMWPSYLGIIVRPKEDHHVELKEKPYFVIIAALSQLESLCKSIFDKTITLNSLNSVKEKSTQFKKLCDAVSPSKTSQYIQYSELQPHLEQCVKLQEMFIDYCDHISILLEYCNCISHGSLTRVLRGKFYADSGHIQVKSLFEITVDQSGRTQFVCTYFSCKDIPNDLLYYLNIVGNIHRNHLFTTSWNRRSESCSNLSSFAAVHAKLCIPVLNECKQILLSLQQRTMTLETVENYFLEFEMKELENCLTQLCQGIKECFPEDKHILAAKKWVPTAVKVIQEYRNISSHMAAAEVVLQLKESMGLTGDFAVIETLAQQMRPGFKKQMLSVINKELIKAGEDLKSISTIPGRCDCLKTFSESTEVVKWLKSETGNVGAVANFVEVATSTTGEGDYHLGRLSLLHTVATGYASLIFDIEPTTSFKDLCKKCSSLWRALEEYPALPDDLVQCKRDLDWYKEIKKIQGSVEVTSVNQVEDINKFGAYTISCVGKKILPSIEDAIVLKISRKNAAKKMYSFDDLRDLESKLVLIRGRSTNGGAEIDRFLDVFHLVCRIAKALYELQNVGHTKYISWSLTFACSKSTATAEKLRNQAMEMENALSVELDSVHEYRRNFHGLNYFTTQQLLQIRWELGNYKQSKPRTQQLYSLLMNYSLNITAGDIEKTVDEVCTLFSEQAANEEVEEESTETQLNVVTETKSVEWRSAEDREISDAKPSNKEHSSKEELCDLISQLSPEEEDIFEQLHALEYSNIVCYKAVKHAFSSTEDDDEKMNVAMEWCFDNCNLNNDVVRASTTANAAETIDAIPHQNVQTKTSHMESYDFQHPVVQQLLDLGYSAELSIKATKLHHGDFEKASEWCLDDETKHHDIEQILFSSVSEIETRSFQPDEGDKVSTSVDWEESWDEESANEYLGSMETAAVLEQIHDQFAGLSSTRSFSEKILHIGEPNLLIVATGNVLKTVLSLYMEDPHLPLPSSAEVFICTPTTTAEEVELLWHRATKDPDYKHIYCLVHAERLSYQVCETAFKEYDSICQGNNNYRTVIICSLEDEERAHVISKLHQYRREYPPLPSRAQITSYLKKHLINEDPSCAARVDPEMSSVRVVASDASGMGKSLYVKKLARQLQRRSKTDPHVIVPVHGPVVNTDIIMTSLCHHIPDYSAPPAQIIHLDIAPSVLSDVDTLLFSLLVLKSLTNSKGYIWQCLPVQYYVIEVTYLNLKLKGKGKKTKELLPSTMSLLELLPTVNCLSPMKVLKRCKVPKTVSTELLMDDETFRSSRFQRVYQYLIRFYSATNLSNFFFIPNTVEGDMYNALCLLLWYCGIKNPSWSELHNFVKFLNTQLEDCEGSIYCNEAVVGDVLQGFKQFVVQFMIRMSRDFATPSLKAAVLHAENEDGDRNVQQEDVTEQYQIVERKAWERNFHPYLFFNRDHVSVTFLGFKIPPDGNLVDPKNDEVIETGLMTEQLRDGLTRQRVNFDEDYNSWNKATMIENLCFVMGIEYPSDPDGSYVLTIDNMKKMLAIHMRFRCNIPVVIMGETGCGKTRLIRYMCDLQTFGTGYQNMLMMKVHGGITERDIEQKMSEVLELAKQNKKASPPVDTVLFFDEANTTEAIGLIKEIMCDRRLNGKPIPEDIKFIAACNPYRKHSKEMINRLENAGLGFYVKSTKTIHKIGSIPLRQLVYRVLALPASMQPLVYDFGQLTDNTEGAYTVQIVKDRIQKNEQLKSYKKKQLIMKIVSHVLAASQMYMRKREDECSFVSLRDVERAMIVFEWFFDKHDIIKMELKDLENKPLHPIIRSLVMAVAVCYHARLQDRREFENFIVRHFVAPLSIPGGAKQFLDEIIKCQTMFLRQMKLGPNIASNAALRENIFMMVVCIELRIPLFLVGKPGSSKSLAKSIIADSMQGHTSHTNFLKELKQVKMFSYQCSQLSTPESVLEVFGTATKFQNNKNKDTTRFVSVVVLDEVGLAEDSPSLPLKALHPLLEDGTSGADSNAQFVARENRVAFIGISNWALDPAKMNRGVMVTRGEPNEEELILSAKGICSVKRRDVFRDRLGKYFEPLAKSYLQICKKQHPKEFFGLRDFYSLIKMLYWMVERTKQPLTMEQLVHAVKRNFGGLDDEVDAISIFKENGIHIANVKCTSDDPSVIAAMYPDCSAMGLIKTSLATKETSWHGESRYLLFLTENYAALRILQQDLLINARNPPFVLFGSSFPKDMEYTQVCRNINQIKICMETGRSVILLNLENLYESLYDVLNQYYTLLPGKRYVDLGLQTHRIKCRVHDDFKLILIAEKDKVYKEFPTPLINRLEKHFVVTSTVLTENQKKLLTEVKAWANKYACVRDFKVGDAFVGYQDDTPAAVVFQVTHLLKNYENETGDEAVVQWKAKALALSKRLLLETASPDSLVRLKALRNDQEFHNCVKIYFEEQYHSCLGDLLKAKLFDPQNPKEGLLLHVTTHSHLMSRVDTNLLYHSLGLRSNQVHCFLLQEFDTEMDFSNKIRPIFRRRTGEDCLLIIQCDAGHLNIDLIACARHRIIDERVSAVQMNSSSNQCVLPLQATHVVFIVQLPKQVGGTKFVGFQGAQWYSVHIDDLSPPKDVSFTLPSAFYHSMSKIFSTNVTSNAIAESSSAGVPLFNASKRIHKLIQTAASRLQDNEENRQRTTGRIQLLIDLIPSEDADYDGERRFHHILIDHISNVMSERDSDMPNAEDWAYIESVDSKKLRQGGTFINCLSRKFDEVIVPIFAKILGSIDKNYNLSLIHNVKDGQSSLIAQLWLGIFSNKQVCRFTYDDVVAKNQKQQQNYRGKVPGIGTLLASPDYICKFPFSWLVKNAIDSQWNNATATATQFGVLLYTQLYDLVSTTALGEFLNDEKFSSHPEECLELYNLYLFDFVKSVYRTTQECEVELVRQAVDSVVQKTHSSGNLLELLIAVHVAYDGVKAHIQQFQQLISMEPSIVDVLIKTVPYPAAEMNLAYFAVQEVLDIFAPKFNQWDHHTVQNWIRKLHKISNVIDTVLSFETEPNTVAEELRIANRHKWQRMCVIKMFAEHISLNFTEDQIIISAKRLWAYLAKPNFQSKATLLKVKKVVDSLDINVRKTWKIEDETQAGGQEVNESQLLQRHIGFRHQCCSFFMEVVSTLCFEPNMPNPPDHDLIMMLMDIVFAEKRSTRILSPFNNEKTDPAPVIRSYLLQLMLEFSYTNVQALLEEYFKRSQDLAQEDQDLYVLCVQCFEDSIFMHSSGIVSLENRIKFTLEMIRKGHSVYQDSDGTITLKYLEAIACLRYGLSFTANCLSEYHHTSGDVGTLQSPLAKSTLDYLFDEVKFECLNSYHGQPHEFLIKYIARQFGMQILKTLMDNSGFNWLIPDSLQPAKKKSATVDSYVLYGKSYKNVREAIALTLCGSDISELQAAIKEFTPDDSIVIPLALYQQITVQAKQVPDEAMKILFAVVQNRTILSKEMQFMTGLLMQKIQFARLHIDSENAHHLSLRDVVIHSAVMLTHKRQEGFLQPFVRLINVPSTMQGAYLPTMPDDSLFHAMTIMAGSYYTCPKGHPYHIGDCGGAAVQARCPECGSTIGGVSHTLAAGNNPVHHRGDTTHTGHVLGSPERRSVLPEPERSLPPSGCALLRLLLHAVLVWSSSNADNNDFTELASIIHPGIPGEYTAQFFWKHLQRDVDVLSKSLNLNKDDAILVVHIFLRHISQLQQFPECDSSLSSKQLREQWEKQFYKTCMLPVLQDTQKHLRKALHLIANDDSQEHDALFFTIYEKMSVHSGDIQPALWRYRTRITLEHLTHILQQNTGKGLKILKQFLHLEPVLRVTQYLPDILYLQKLLFDQFHQRFDQGKALEMSIKKYLMKLNNDHLRNTILKLTISFDKAWVVARKHLLNYGRLRVPEEYITAMPTINECTKLTYLIPTTTGEGICSTGLVDFLVVTHNYFIKYYHDHYPLSEKYREDELMKNSIPLSQLQDCHLLNYESHIIPVVLNHCHHSLEVGKGTDIQYDLPALEKKIVDRFIHGKPLIQFENAPRVVYRKDTHDAEKFNDVRTKVQQETITTERQKMILAELRSPQKLSEVLDVIDVVLGFLASAGGNPSMSLGDYAKKILKMNRRLFPKIIQECTLANTLSLWEVLSVEQARQLTLINQDPFDQVDNAFKGQLSSDLLKRLHLALRRFPLNCLLSVLHEFIITHVSHVDLTEQQQHQWLLKDTMEGFLERQNLPEFQELEHFPDDLLMCHVTNTWKEIVLYQNQVEH